MSTWAEEEMQTADLEADVTQLLTIATVHRPVESL
jgi:hypothetical protein